MSRIAIPAADQTPAASLPLLAADEIDTNRHGSSNEPKAAAAVRFATQVVSTRGHVSDAEVAAVKAAGYSNAEVIEIVLHVALNTLTNYVNEVAMTEVDFPVVKPFS